MNHFTARNTDSQDGRSITRSRPSRTHLITSPRTPACDFRGSPRKYDATPALIFFFPLLVEYARASYFSPRFSFSSSYRVRVIARCISRYAFELSYGGKNMKFRTGRSNFSILLRPPFLSYRPRAVPAVPSASGPRREIVNKMQSTGRRCD